MAMDQRVKPSTGLFWSQNPVKPHRFHTLQSCPCTSFIYKFSIFCFIPFGPPHAWKWSKLWLLEMGLTKFSPMGIVSKFQDLFSNSTISLLISPIIQSISLFLCFITWYGEFFVCKIELTENTASVLKLSWRNKHSLH